MHSYALATFLLCFINVIVCAPAPDSNVVALADHPQHSRLSGRSPKYDFGLGKRRYIFRSTGTGSKRIPHYDFGLGKRSMSIVNPYSFGLGKRADAWEYDDLYAGESAVDGYYNNNKSPYVESQNGLEIPLDMDAMEAIKAVYEPKRSRPYSFGLGKRGRNYDFGLGR